MTTIRSRAMARTIAALLFFTAALGARSLAAGDPAPAAQDRDERPNVVWLLSEDNSLHWLRLFDASGAETPHIRALADHGLRFEHAFSNAPVCSVARTTLMTGCYAPRIGTLHHRKIREVPLPGDLRMFPAYLREAGYYTSNRQKKDYNAIEGDGVWDESSRRATWRDRAQGQPFFHMQSFATTHESSLHFSPEQMRGQETATSPDDVRIAPYHPDTSTFRYTYARYHDRIRQVDREIGAVVDDLEEDGLLESTFVFYFGDHGGVLPRSKGYAYDSGLHVPLVVRVPERYRELAGRELGSAVRGFVSFIDFGPTVLRLAGLRAPGGMDGRAFLGRGVSAAAIDARRESLGHADRFDEKYDMVRTLRIGRFEYVRSYQPFNYDGLRNNYRYRMLAYAEWLDLHREGTLSPAQRAFFERRAPEALYDLEADPHETRDLAGDPDHAFVLATMRSALTRRLRRLPDLGFLPESVLVRDASGDPTGFGRERADDIAAYLRIADLSLAPFDEARRAIEDALGDGDPWARYHGLITCSSHGEDAEPLAALAKRLADDDPELLVRVRAAEFLGLIGERDPRAVLHEALSATTSPVEALLILNSVVLLRDGKPGYDIPVSAKHLNPAVRDDPLVLRRLEYLAPAAAAED